MDLLEEALGEPLAVLFRRQLALEKAAARRMAGTVLGARDEVARALVAAKTALFSGGEVIRQVERAAAAAAHTLSARMLSAFAPDARVMATLGAAVGAKNLPAALPAALPALGGLPHTAQAALDTYHASLITDVTDDLRNQVTKQVRMAILAGTPTEEAAKQIGLTGIRPTGPFRTAYERAETIARTELNRIGNMAASMRIDEAAQHVPTLMKEWVTAGDNRVRPTHVAADGQRVPADGVFHVGGFSARYPCDPALPASEAVNCRCRVIAVRGK